MIRNSNGISLKKRMGPYYSGSFYEGDRSLLLWLFGKFLARVKMSDEFVGEMKDHAQKGTVVYALKNKSQLNALIVRELTVTKQMERPNYCHGINMLLWQPFSKALKACLSRFFHNPYREEYLKELTVKGMSSIIYLRDSEFFGSRYPQDPLMQLVAAQMETEKPILIVPHLVAYSMKREKKDKTISDIFFGQTENPGIMRRLITFLRYSHQAFVVSSDAIDLGEFLRMHSDESLEAVIHLLRREIIDRIDAEKLSTVGPVLKSREEVISMVLRDPEVISLVQSTSEAEGKEYREIISRAKKYLLEIAANYKDTYIGVFDKLLTWLWNNIYDGLVIDREGLIRMRQIAKKMPFVVVPCHRSHIDYLLLSYVFYKNNLQMPFVAAGINMAFWPLGHFFRRSGAFFLRRSFKGNPLYGTLFAKYVKVLLKEGWPIEFFIEGGRSRTGKMVMPKFGLLSMIIQAYKEGICDDLAIIPIYVGYDRVMEEKSYRRELEGAGKVRETASSLIKNRGVLKKRYGSVYLNIGEPIFLKSHLASQDVRYEEMSVDLRQRLYRKTSYEIAERINRVSVVTPFALSATALLCHYKRGISHDDFMDILNLFHDYLDHKGASFSSTFAERDKAIAEALSKFESSGMIVKTGFDEDEAEEFREVIYSVDEDKRLDLEYYKNNILHFFLTASFVSTSLLSGREGMIPLATVIEDYRFFKRLFRHEFIFDEHLDDVDEVADVLSYLNEKEMIVGHEDDGEAGIEVRGIGQKYLSLFMGLLHNYLESYWITLRGCSYLKEKPRQERDFLKKLQKLGTKMYKKGEVSKAEALSQMTYKSAVRFLADARILNVSYESKDDKSKKKPVKTLSLSDDKGQMDSLRRRLFNLMSL